MTTISNEEQANLIDIVNEISHASFRLPNKKLTIKDSTQSILEQTSDQDLLDNLSVIMNIVLLNRFNLNASTSKHVLARYAIGISLQIKDIEFNNGLFNPEDKTKLLNSVKKEIQQHSINITRIGGTEIEGQTLFKEQLLVWVGLFITHYYECTNKLINPSQVDDLLLLKNLINYHWVRGLNKLWDIYQEAQVLFQNQKLNENKLIEDFIYELLTNKYSGINL